MQIRIATLFDVPDLARMNLQFIRDEGHRNPMNLEQLTERMQRWLHGEYVGVIVEEFGSPIGYALYRLEPDYAYLRQFYVVADHRRKGIGRQVMYWLWENAWSQAKRVRIDVLIDNHVGQAFWRSVGFADYCITMEAQSPPDCAR